MKFLLTAIGLLSLVSCRQAAQESVTGNYTIAGDTIVIPANSSLHSRLKTGTLQSEPCRLQLFTAGIVKAIATQYAEIAPPFPGRITRSYLQLGMKTVPGTPLFEMSSPDFITAQKVFFQAKSQLQQAEKTLKRQQDLQQHGVGTQKDVEEARTAYDVEKKEFENALIGIKIFSTDPDRLSLGQPLVVRSPVRGTVIENKVVQGQFLRADAASVATVADLSDVWIAGQVKEKDIHFIHENAACTIAVAALPGQQITGNIYHVNEVVDEATRSIAVLINVSNKDRLLKPGMYATVHFTDTAAPAILIPSKAILQAADASFVFIEKGAGRYVKQKVETGSADRDRVVIKEGLNAGDKIVLEGGFYLPDIK